MFTEDEILQKKYYIYKGVAISVRNSFIGLNYAIKAHQTKEIFDTKLDIEQIKRIYNEGEYSKKTQENAPSASDEFFLKLFVCDVGDKDFKENCLVRWYAFKPIVFPVYDEYTKSDELRKLENYEILND